MTSGLHHVEKAPRIGIELDEAIGKHKGKVKGHQYFACAAKRGVLVSPAKVSLSGRVALGSTLTRDPLPPTHRAPRRLCRCVSLQFVAMIAQVTKVGAAAPKKKKKKKKSKEKAKKASKKEKKASKKSKAPKAGAASDNEDIDGFGDDAEPTARRSVKPLHVIGCAGASSWRGQTHPNAPTARAHACTHSTTRTTPSIPLPIKPRTAPADRATNRLTPTRRCPPRRHLHHAGRRCRTTSQQ